MTNPAGRDNAPWSSVADRVAEELDADVFFYNGPIQPPLDRQFMALCRQRKKRTNVLLILVTLGGDPDSAYRMARHLQAHYDRFLLYVTGYCKSAGTLVALGAHELILGEDGELGPLDVQMSKQDSLWEQQSGLTVNAALTALQDKAYLAFESFFLETEERSLGAITVKTAGDIAAKLTIGLFAPLYSQVDPLHVGEAARAMQVADNYGRRLMMESKNLDPNGLHHLVTHYPSHGFVIDMEEATTVFEQVRVPTESEEALAAALDDSAIEPQVDPKRTVMKFLSKEMEQPELVSQPPIAVIADGLADVPIPENPHGGAKTGPRASAARPTTQSGA